METPPGGPNGIGQSSSEPEIPFINGHGQTNEDSHSGSRTPELPQQRQHQPEPDSPNTLEELEPFDWGDFEARYEAALFEASEEERAILKEAESLSKYFQAWASAASAHDDARAVKRLQTRQRFVNLSEEKLFQKQQHYVEVVRAFESALALLKSN